MARSLAEAFVALEPDATGFATKAKALLDKTQLEKAATITLNAARAQIDIAALQARIKALTARAAQIQVGVDDKAGQAELLRLDAQLSALSRRVANPKITIEGQQRALASILALDAAFDKFDAKLAGADATAAAAGGSRGGFALLGGWFRVLGAQVPLFGGALGALPLIGTVSGFHLLAEAIIETSAVVIPAAIAFGAFGAAAVPTVQAIVQQMKTLYTVSQATGQQIPGLSGGFQKMAAAVQPQVYTLFGEALDTLNSRGSQFTTLAKNAGSALDQLGARAEVAFTSGGMSSFIKNGPADMAKIGDIIGNIFGTVGNFLRVMPGYAEDLLTIFDKVTKGIEAVTSSGIVQGFLKAGLAAHGFALYAGLAATAVGLLGSPLGAAANALAGLGKSSDTASAQLDANAGRVAKAKAGWSDLGNALPLIGTRLSGVGKDAATAGEGAAAAGEDAVKTAGKFSLATAGTKLWGGALGLLTAIPVGGWVAAGAVAIGGLVYWLATAKDATQKWYDATEQGITSQKTLTGVVTATQNALYTANQQLAATPKYIDSATAGQGRFAEATTHLNTQYTEWASNAQNVHAQLGTESTRLLQLVQMFGSAANAQDAMNTVGIKAGDIADANASKWAQDIAQLKAYADSTVTLAGYQGGMALAAQNALNAAQDSQAQAISKITKAQDDLVTVMISGQTSLDTFQEGMITLADNFNQVTGSGSTANFTLAHVKDQVSLAGAAMDGTTAASYALNQAFYTQIQNSQKLIDALEQQGASSGDVTKATATMAGQMLGFAGNSTAARTALVAQINDALGPGTVSLQTLDSWVNKNSVSQKALKDIINKTTGEAVGLSNALANQVDPMLAQAASSAYGGQKALTAFATALANGATQSQLIQKTLPVVSQLIADNSGNASKAHAQFDAWGISMGASRTQMDQLWGAATKEQLTNLTRKASETWPEFKKTGDEYGYNASQLWSMWQQAGRQQLDMLANKASTTWPQFQKVGAQYQWNASQLWSMWNQAHQQYLDALASKAGTTWPMFQKLGEQYGYNASQIWSMWNQAHNWAARSPYKGDVEVTGSGKWYITGGGTVFPNAKIPVPALTGATGGLIQGPGSKTSDSVPALLSHGEYVIQASSVDKYGKYVLDALNAGALQMAGGGYINATLGSVTGGYGDGAPGLQNWSISNKGSAANDTGLAIQYGVASDIVAAIQALNRMADSPGPGGGVSRWTNVVDAALRLLGLPLGLASRVLYQMGTESGGNQYAINNWDINAQRGDPSRGLMQVIGSTFARYHVAGTSWDIYDPLANIAAAINYAEHVYGPTLGALGSGHGYDQGGFLPPGLSLAYNGTGRPEAVGPAAAGGATSAQAATLIQQNAQIITLLQQAPAKTGAHTAAGVGDALKGVSSSIRQRGYYGTR